MPRISTWIQVPSGVLALQDATSSSSAKPGSNNGDVQVAESYVTAVPSPNGSVYVVVPVGRTIEIRPWSTLVPSRSPWASCVVESHAWIEMCWVSSDAPAGAAVAIGLPSAAATVNATVADSKPTEGSKIRSRRKHARGREPLTRHTRPRE